MTTVLLVEDDQFIADITGQKLVAVGYEVVVAVDAATAMTLFSDQKPNVVVLDIDLPDASGSVVLEKIRETSSVPVIVFSNNDDPGIKAELESLGANSFFVKATTEVAELAREIERLIS